MKRHTAIDLSVMGVSAAYLVQVNKDRTLVAIISFIIVICVSAASYANGYSRAMDKTSKRE